SLWEPRASETTGRNGATDGSSSSVEAQRAQLRQHLAELRRTLAESHPDVAQTKVRIEVLERQLDELQDADRGRVTLAVSLPRRAVIDTTFTMEVGETVV